MDAACLNQLEQMLKETPCQSVNIAHGFLQIVFGETERLVIQSAWRLVFGGEIMLADGDNTDAEKSRETASTLLCGKRVLSVHVASPFHDLEIQFDNTAVVQAYSNSSNYENWYITGKQHQMIIAGPGTLYSQWEPQKIQTLRPII